MPVVKCKGCKSKTNRHKHNDIKQAAVLKMSGLHSMQTEQSKRHFQAIETKPPILLYNCLLSNSTLHWSYLQEGLFSHQSVLVLFFFIFFKPFLTGGFTLHTLFPYGQQQSQVFFQTANIPLSPFFKLLKHTDWNLSSGKDATAYCWPQVSLC